MRKPVIFILFILQIVTSATIAQDVVFSASARDVVRTGERFQVIYTLNANGKEFRTPDMKDFMVISGPHTSQSSSIQIINGKVSRSVENSYTLYVVGNKDGIFTIPPATIKVDDKTYKSNAVKIQVVKSNNQAQQQGSSGGSNTKPGSSTQSSNSATNIKDDVLRIGKFILTGAGIWWLAKSVVMGTFQNYKGFHDPVSTLVNTATPMEGLVIPTISTG